MVGGSGTAGRGRCTFKRVLWMIEIESAEGS